MAKAGAKAAPTREEEVLAAVRAAKTEGDTTRIRKAALELLSAIHEKMAGVTEEEVLAILEADKKKARRTASTHEPRAGERTRRRPASA
jgi:hypothetical protein